MDSKAIETLAISAVKDCIVKTKYLDQFIPDNDKEPSWDGNVYIYEHLDKKKDHLIGRLPVQVKGKVNDDHRKTIINYKIQVADLRNYLNDGGAIYFVVYINSKTYQKKIYYLELPPIKIRLMLAAGNQKTITAKLKELPSQSDRIATLFMNCFTNCKQQSSFSSAKLYSLQELQEQGVLEGLTASVTGLGQPVDFDTAFLNNEVYFYAQIKGSSIPQPLLEIPQNLEIQRDLSMKVCTGGKEYYNTVTRIRSLEKVEFRIGSSLVFSFKKDLPYKINYYSSSNLRSLVVDLSFMLDVIKNKSFEINGHTFTFNIENAKFTDYDIAIQENRLNYYNRVVSALNKLNCNKDIDFSTLDKESFKNLDYLVRIFADNHPMISNLPPDLPPVLNLDIGDLSFILWLEQQSDDPTTYCFYDFFDVNARFSIAGDSSKPITQYALLGKKELLNTNNLQTTKLLPAFQELPKQPYVYERANQMLLDLLSAYDETNGTRQDLLKLAFDFACWLANAPEEMLGKKLSYINKFQVIRRMRELCKNEKDQLCVIAADPETPEELKVGAYLLLDSQDMAEYHFKNLSSEKQSTITNYPIRLFWKTNIQE